MSALTAFLCLELCVKMNIKFFIDDVIEMPEKELGKRKNLRFRLIVLVPPRFAHSVASLEHPLLTT